MVSKYIISELFRESFLEIQVSEVILYQTDNKSLCRHVTSVQALQRIAFEIVTKSDSSNGRSRNKLIYVKETLFCVLLHDKQLSGVNTER